MTTLTGTGRELERRIPLPRDDRPPLKVNLFEKMQGGNCTLLPLFPHEDADSLVPAGALLRGGPGVDYGQFFHFNTVDEVVHVFGGNGALLQTGQIYATQQLHGVNSFLKDSTNPEYFMVTAITQHQRASGPQNYEYDAQPAPRGVHPRNGVPLFTTLQGSVDAAETLNEHPANRHCAKCGYDNPAFPLERWGWRQYVERTHTVNEARRALDAAAAQAFGTAEARG